MCEEWSSLCLSSVDDSPVGLCLEAFLFIYSFIGLAKVCDEALVPALETLCIRWSIREDVAGATIMALGSAMPELLINAITTVKGGEDTSDLGVGAILGSGMVAFSVIPAVCAFGSPRDLPLKKKPLLRDIGFYTIALVALCIFLADGLIVAYESALLIGIYLIYVLFVVLSPSLGRAYHTMRRRRRQMDVVQNVISAGAHSGQIQQLREHFLNTSTAEDAQHAKNQFQVGGDTAAKDAKPSANSSFSFLGEWADRAPTIRGFGAHKAGKERAGKLDDTLVVLTHLEENAHATQNAVSESENAKDEKKEASTEENGVAQGMQAFSIQEPEVDGEALIENGENDSDDSSESGPPSLLSRIWDVVSWPLSKLFAYTTIKCDHDSPQARLYPLGFFLAFLWLSFFSVLISSVVERWVTLSGVPSAFFGLVLVSIGAEIPDTVGSLSVARRGYGVLAISNSSGSQIANILLSLGLPWMIENIRLEASGGGGVEIPAHWQLTKAAFLQFANLGHYFSQLLVVAFIKRSDRAQLTKLKGRWFMIAYFACLGTFALITFL